MKTLVIHPTDPSTRFAEVFYQDIPNKTVMTGAKRYSDVWAALSSHDRILMIGHGSPTGLFAVGQFPGSYVIDANHSSLLRSKEDTVYIWCHADQYVRRHGLRGYATGMFVSEVVEAAYTGVGCVDQKTVDDSNNLYFDEVRKVISGSAADIYRATSQGAYADLAKTNPVAAYNLKRLQLFEGRSLDDDDFLDPDTVSELDTWMRYGYVDIPDGK